MQFVDGKRGRANRFAFSNGPDLPLENDDGIDLMTLFGCDFYGSIYDFFQLNQLLSTHDSVA